jgi:hypothetical protein
MVEVGFNHILLDRIPTLTLMRNAPPVNRNPPSIRLLPRPFQRHIARTHDALSDIINAMVDMLSSIQTQHLSFLLSLVEDRGVFAEDPVHEHPVVLAQLAEAVKLVEEGDGVDLAPGCVLPGREVV